jgi:hypothetical protein
MAEEHKAKIDEMIKQLQAAAEQLEMSKSKSAEEAEADVVDVQSCCGTCTGITAISPCRGTCILLSALF